MHQFCRRRSRLVRAGDYKGLKELLVKNLVPATNSKPDHDPESAPPSPSM
ncbi:MAG: hypothetical protein OXC57_07470 [Rhodobacteraceae bacterium]|nr:hypothetical protein [Paracoccaceae bacterium]